MKTNHVNQTKDTQIRKGKASQTVQTRWNARWLEAAKAACAVVFLGEGNESEQEQQPKGA